MPYLRRLTIQRENDEKRQAEAKRQAKLRRLELEKQHRNIGKKNIADMGITFDGQGSILKIKKPDPSRFNDISQTKDIIQSEVRDDLTEVIQSEAIQRLKTMRSLKKDQSDKHMLIDDEELMSSNYGQVPMMAEGALENKRGKNLIAKNETQVENTPNTVGNVQPNYGVRMKNNLKKEKFSKPNLHQEAKSQNVNPNTQSFDQVENTFRSKYS